MVICYGCTLWFFTWTTTTCPSRYPITTHQWLLFSDITNIYPDYIDYQILYALLLQYYTSILPQWNTSIITIGLPYLQSQKKNEKGFITILLFEWFYCYLTVWHLFGGLHFERIDWIDPDPHFWHQLHLEVRPRLGTWKVHGCEAGFYSNLSLQNVWLDRSILYRICFCFCFLLMYRRWSISPSRI